MLSLASVWLEAPRRAVSSLELGESTCPAEPWSHTGCQMANSWETKQSKGKMVYNETQGLFREINVY